MLDKNLTDLENTVMELDSENQRLHSIRRRKKMTPTEDLRAKSVIPRPRLISVDTRTSTPVLTSKANFDIPEGIKKLTKSVSKTSEQTLFTLPTPRREEPMSDPFPLPSIKVMLIGIFVFLLMTIMLLVWKRYQRTIPSVQFRKTIFIKDHIITNHALQKGLVNACKERNVPMSIVLAGESVQIMEKTAKSITSMLEPCGFKAIHLEAPTVNKWKNLLHTQLVTHPKSIILMDVHSVHGWQIEFLHTVLKEDPILSVDGVDVYPKNAIFLFLSDYGAGNFQYVRKSDLLTEERDYKQEIQKSIESEWPESLNKELNVLIPLVHDHH
jgi:hypothetical protein